MWRCRIKSQFKVDDVDSNPGVVISPRTTHVPYNKLTVKLIVSGDFITEPVMFTCDGLWDNHSHAYMHSHRWLGGLVVSALNL